MYPQQPNTPAPGAPVPPDEELDLDEFEERVARSYGIPRGLRNALKGQESGGRDVDQKTGRPITSPKGAQGRYQVMPDTVRKYGLDPNNEYDRVYAGLKYLKEKYDSIDPKISDPIARWSGALAGYHGGEAQINNINKTGGEVKATSDGLTTTDKYVDSIMSRWKKSSQGGQSNPGGKQPLSPPGSQPARPQGPQGSQGKPTLPLDAVKRGLQPAQPRAPQAPMVSPSEDFVNRFLGSAGKGFAAIPEQFAVFSDAVAPYLAQGGGGPGAIPYSVQEAKNYERAGATPQQAQRMAQQQSEQRVNQAVTNRSAPKVREQFTVPAEQAIERALPLDPNITAQGGFFQKDVPEGGGSMAAFFASGLAGRALGAPRAMNALYGALSNAQRTIREYDASGKNSESARAATYAFAAAIGSLEALGLGKTIEKFGGKQKAVEYLLNSGEEFLQEYTNAVLDDVNAGYVGAYDPTRAKGLGILTSSENLKAGALGGFLGGATNLASAGAERLMGQQQAAPTAPAPQPGPQAPQRPGPPTAEQLGTVRPQGTQQTQVINLAKAKEAGLQKARAQGTPAEKAAAVKNVQTIFRGQELTPEQIGQMYPIPEAEPGAGVSAVAPGEARRSAEALRGLRGTAEGLGLPLVPGFGPQRQQPPTMGPEGRAQADRTAAALRGLKEASTGLGLTSGEPAGGTEDVSAVAPTSTQRAAGTLREVRETAERRRQREENLRPTTLPSESTADQGPDPYAFERAEQPPLEFAGDRTRQQAQATQGPRGPQQAQPQPTTGARRPVSRGQRDQQASLGFMAEEPALGPGRRQRTQPEPTRAQQRLSEQAGPPTPQRPGPQPEGMQGRQVRGVPEPTEQQRSPLGRKFAEDRRPYSVEPDMGRAEQTEPETRADLEGMLSRDPAKLSDQDFDAYLERLESFEREGGTSVERKIKQTIAERVKRVKAKRLRPRLEIQQERDIPYQQAKARSVTLAQNPDLYRLLDRAGRGDQDAAAEFRRRAPDVGIDAETAQGMIDRKRGTVADLAERRGPAGIPEESDKPEAGSTSEETTGRIISHSTLGEVEEVKNQRGVPRGYLRVRSRPNLRTGIQKTSIIKNPRISGNRNAAFVKTEAKPEVEPKKAAWQMTETEWRTGQVYGTGEKDVITIKSGRKTITVYKNPGTAERTEINKEFREAYPNAPAGEPRSRFTIDQNGNRYEWASSAAIHMQVEPALEERGIIANQNTSHRDIVEKALADGKQVPPEVLAEYPGLARKQQSTEAPAKKTTGPKGPKAPKATATPAKPMIPQDSPKAPTAGEFEAGDVVEWSYEGMRFRGRVIGSAGPGKALVTDDAGERVTVSVERLRRRGEKPTTPTTEPTAEKPAEPAAKTSARQRKTAKPAGPKAPKVPKEAAPKKKVTRKSKTVVESAREQEATRTEAATETAERRGSILESAPTGVRTASGDETSLKIPRTDKEYPARYAVRELGDIQPSHDPQTFAKNPKYNLVNDRDYSSPANRIDVEEATKAGIFDPRLVLTDDPTATNGPPVIIESGDVLGGNSRTMMLGRVYKNHPADAEKYRQALKKRAGMFGLDATEIDGFKEPVLVRIIDSKPENLQKLITDLNIQPGKALSSTEAATARAKQMPAATMQYLADRLAAEGPDGTLAQALEGGKGVNVLNRLIEDDVIPRGERNRYLTDQGALTPAAKQEIETMLLGRLFRDADQMKATAPEMRNKLTRVAPHLAKMASTEWDISNLIPNAIEAANAAKSQKLDVSALNQRGFLFGEGVKYSAEELAIAELLKDSGPRQIENVFRKYAAEFDSAQQGAGLFGDPPTQQEAFSQVFKPEGAQGISKPLFVEEAEQRLEEGRQGKLGAGGPSAQELVDMAVVSGWKLYRKGIQFTEWARSVIAEVGQKVRPYLRAAWDQIQKTGFSVGPLKGESRGGQILSANPIFNPDAYKQVGADLKEFIASRLRRGQTAKDLLPMITPNAKGNSAAMQAGVKKESLDFLNVGKFLEENPNATKAEIETYINENEPKLSVMSVKSASKEIGATTELQTDTLRMAGPSTNYREVMVSWDNPPADQKPFLKVEHYGQKPNVLFDMRLEDRTTADGAKATFFLEGQSDWSQAREAPPTPFKTGWQNKVVEYAIGEAVKNGKDGILLPRTAQQVAEIQRWGRLKEEGGRYLNTGGYDVTPIVNRYLKDFPKLFEKISGQKLETKRVDVGQGYTEDLLYLPLPKTETAKAEPTTARKTAKTAPTKETKSAYWETTPVPRNPDGSYKEMTPAEIDNQINQSRAEFRQHATRGRIYTNEQGAITYTQILMAATGGDPTMASDGLAVSLGQADQALTYLQEKVKTHPSQQRRTVYNNLIDVLEQAVSSAKTAGKPGFVIVNTEAKALKRDPGVVNFLRGLVGKAKESKVSSFEALRETIAHEETHIFQFEKQLSHDKGLSLFDDETVKADPDYEQHRKALVGEEGKGYDDDPQTIGGEAMAYAVSGGWYELGYKSERDAVKYLERTFERLYDEYGPEAMQGLRLRTRAAQEARENAGNRRERGAELARSGGSSSAGRAATGAAARRGIEQSTTGIDAGLRAGAPTGRQSGGPAGAQKNLPKTALARPTKSPLNQGQPAQSGQRSGDIDYSKLFKSVGGQQAKAQTSTTKAKKVKLPQTAAGYFQQQLDADPFNEKTAPRNRQVLQDAKKILKQAADRFDKGKILDDQKEQIITAADDLMVAAHLGDREAIVSARRELAKAVRGGSKVRTAAYWAGEALRTSRTLTYGSDLSYAFRQALPLTVYPKNWADSIRAGREMMRALVSADKTQQIKEWMQDHEAFDLAEKAGLEFAMFGKNEEIYDSDIAGKIPLWGKLLTRTQAANEVYLDYLRLTSFAKMTKGIQDNPNMSPKQQADAMTAMAEVINTLTGRTSLGEGRIKSAIEGAQAIMTAPRLNYSRIQMLNPAKYKQLYDQHPAAAKEMLYQTGFAVSSMAGLGLLLAAAGLGSFVTDTDDPDFGKLVIGNTRYDLFGGLLPVAKVFWDIGETATNLGRTAITNDKTTKRELSESRKSLGSRMESFARGRLTPGVGFGYDLFYKGKDMAGNPVNPEELKKLSFSNPALRPYTPAILNEMVDGYRDAGLKGVAKSTPSIIGIGASTYNPKERLGYLERKTPFMKAAADLGVRFKSVKRNPDDDDNSYKVRTDRVDRWLNQFGPRLLNHSGFKGLDAEDKREALESLRARVGGQSSKRSPETDSFDAESIVESVRAGKARKKERRGDLIYPQASQ